MSESLHELLSEWKKWAPTTSSREDGWQSSFPRWEELIDAAEQTMRAGEWSPADLRALEECWLLSEESEDLKSLTERSLPEVMPVLEELAKSEFPEVRWQVYATLAESGPEGEELLRKGVQDADSYARRRAYLSLAAHRPPDARALCEQLIGEEDPYLRQVSVEMARWSSDPHLKRTVQRELSNDPVEHVRTAAEGLSES